MKLFKKAGCILLSFVLLLSMLPMTAFAEPESSLLDGYTELELEWTQGYYNSQSGANITADSQFMSTQKFTKADLPVGTVIVLQPGWTYRPDGWLAGSSYTSKVNRPAPVRLAAAEGATASYVVVDEDWWKVKVYDGETVTETTQDDYAERVFVINRNPHNGAVTEAEVKAAFKIYLPPHEHNFDAGYCTCGELPEGYEELELGWTALGYWNSANKWNYNKIITDKTAAETLKTYCTIRFTKADLPVGSVIVLQPGWQYRPEAWVTDAQQTARYSNLVTAQDATSYVVVTEEWWGSYTMRAFNIHKADGSSLEEVAADDVKAAFKIYTPPCDHDVDINNNGTCTKCGKKNLIPEGYEELELGWTALGYWNSANKWNYNKIITDKTAAETLKTYCTIRFTKADLPVGSVIVLQPGWQYRPEAWVTDAQQTARYSNLVTAQDATSYVVVTEEWWGDYTLRAFNIHKADGSSLEEVAADDVKAAFKIYTPTCAHEEYVAEVIAPTCTQQGYTKYTCKCGHSYIDENTYVAPTGKHGAIDVNNNGTCAVCGEKYLIPESYVELGLGWTALGYWDCANKYNRHNEIIKDAAGVSEKSYCTIQFTKEQLPVGSVIVLKEGWEYRPEAWLEEGTNTRPANVKESYVVVTEEWWGNYTKRAFNIYKTGVNSLDYAGAATEVQDAFKIYAPGTHTLDGVENVHNRDNFEVIAPNCTQQGYTVYTCECGVKFNENYVDSDINAHIYDADCDAKCNVCGESRTSPSEHVYDADCDAKCNVCGETRTPLSQHVYDSACDAICNVCKAERATELSHNYGGAWLSDETGHWLRCQNDGCTQNARFAEHTPDHEGGATEEYAITCTVCGYVIEEKKEQAPEHTHVYDREVVAEDHKATDATCTAPATYYKSCECGENGTDTFASGDALGHTAGEEWYFDDTNHWHTCTVQGCGAVIEASKVAHAYDHDCDTTCDVCGYVRTVGDHVDTNDAWESNETQHYHTCSCGTEFDHADHTYTNDCDTTCDVCGYVRIVGDHVDANDAWESNETQHYHTCSCGTEFDHADHTYTNACDTTCDDCGYERTVGAHVDADGEWESNETQHFHTCACGTAFDHADHNYTNDCDTTCDVCEKVRTVGEHVYDNACDADCNECGAERTPSDHVYDNNCDATCNECGAERTPSDHVYTNDCDKDCNVCGATRTPSAHVYDDDIDTTCNVCGAVRVVGDYVAKIGKTYYESFAEAVAAAKNGDYIYILCDLEGEGIVIDKDINIVLGGFTYTITSGVGSEGTETGFQILEGCKVSISNGTIKVVENLISVLIYSDADLTLRDMTLDGTNLYGNESCTLFIGNGNVLVNNNTTIINSADNYAISVSDGYALPTLELGSKAIVEGKIYAAAKNGKYYYATLQQAIDSAAYIDLCRDYVGKGFVIDKAVGINLAGYTITITEGVGSEGIGIQILSGNKVSFRNGTIQVADSAKDQIAILIQNYADLTITTVVLDGKNLEAASGSCILAINGGNAKVNGGSQILSSEREDNNDLAVGVYADGVVQITNDVTVDGGKAEVSDRIHAIRCTNYYYGNLQNVLDKQSTAILMCNMEGAGVVINKNAIIDFNGYTYTITSGVGSEGAETGFQILKGKVSFKNGTIQVADSAKDKIATIIQNDADLTITDVVIDANIGGENDSYIISVNSADGNDFSAIRFNNVTINGVKAEESVEIQAAAKRGQFYYASLEHAIAHKDKNSTKYDLILLSDVVLKDLAVIGGTKSLVLDLNGHTITADYDDSSDAFRILTTVTFKNGTVESDNGYCFIVGNETTAGKLVIVSGEYTAVDHDVFKLENGLLVDKRPREDATE